MPNKKRSLLESYRADEWEVINAEGKKEFHEKQMERIGDIVEKYIWMNLKRKGK